MKLEVGMYVRTKCGIGKLLYFNEELEEWVNEEYNYYTEDYIVKASYNIMGLIEVGDVIIDKEGHKYPINYEFETDYNNEYGSYEITIDDNITLFFKDGLSIVTKEQFEAMQYEVV